MGPVCSGRYLELIGAESGLRKPLIFKRIQGRRESTATVGKG
mgnify:CR=1 FL=1